MEDLDDPTVLEIFSFLDSVSLLKIAGALSKHFYSLARENSLWINLLKVEFDAAVWHEKYKASAMHAFDVAKRYRERAGKYFGAMKSLSEQDVDNNKTWEGVCEFIRIVESKRGGLVLCTDGMHENREMLAHSIVYMLFRHPNISIWYSFQGENPRLYEKVVETIDLNIAEVQESTADYRVLCDIAHEYKRHLENGSTFFYGSIYNVLTEDARRIFCKDMDLVINFMTGKKLSYGSPMFSSMSHMLDSNTWPQEKTIHVVTAPNYFGGELNRLWLSRNKKRKVHPTHHDDTHESLDCMAHIETQNQEHIVIDTELLLDEKAIDDRKGFWKKFTVLHPRGDGEEGCIICNKRKKQDAE